jgi:hypothetical protein
MDVKMTEEDTNLITYCGLYCGDCHSFKGRIPDLARDLRRELRTSKYDKFAEVISKEPFGRPLRNYKECYEALGMMVKFRCKKGCKNGGGPPFCKIRKCCQKKGIEGCWECLEFETCTKLDFLRGVHGEAHIKNLRAIKKKGKKEFVNGKRLW